MPVAPVLLLAGPIVRRVTATDVNVWVAISQPCDVTVDLYSSEAFANHAPDAPVSTVEGVSVATGKRATVQASAGLHIAVVTVDVDLLPNARYSYNVSLSVTGPAADGAGWSGTWDLAGLGLLTNPPPDIPPAITTPDYAGGLGYAESVLPGFVSPPGEIADLRLVHGSCFKMHGDGPSAFPDLDDQIGDSVSDAVGSSSRPHLLVLTGDQIYADDVATCLLPALNTTGAQLLGPNAIETVPVPGSDKPVPVTMAALPGGRRQKLVRVQGGMSSDDCHNHLIGFGEYAALYLMSWTGETASAGDKHASVWKTPLGVLPVTGDQTVPEGAQVVLDGKAAAGPIDSMLTPLFSAALQETYSDLVGKFAAQTKAVQGIAKDGDKVRRALANVPVLTICDDHDVTDDFFMTGRWRTRVLGSALGRAMLRNALVAYVLFQAWGNTPARFAAPLAQSTPSGAPADKPTPEVQLLDLIPKLYRGPVIPDPAIAAQVDTLLGLDDVTGTGTVPRVQFNYHQDIAGARLVVLDTRTHREYGTPDGPPGLLTQDALDAQLPVSLTDDVPVLIVVSPAPVLGPPLIEEIFVPAVARAYDVYHLALREGAVAEGLGIDSRAPFGDIFLDTESWSARPAAFQRFLARVTRCPSVVILAGDVHYAFSASLDYHRYQVAPVDGGVTPDDPLPASPDSRVVHFTSSAIKNGWMAKVATFARSIGVAENLERFGTPRRVLGWHRITPPVFPDETPALAPGEPRPMRARLQREPVVLTSDGWSRTHHIRPPEWGYELEVLFDRRPDEERFTALATELGSKLLATQTPDARSQVIAGGTDWPGLGGAYETAAAIHSANVNSGVVTRGIVFANNLGVVTFARDKTSNELSVSMGVRFQRAHPVTDSEKPQAYVLHQASLSPVALAAPDHVGGN